MECLGKLSGKTCQILGKGCSFSINVPAGCSADQDRRIFLRCNDVTLGEILKPLGEAAGATIEITENGLLATYGKPPGTKP